jgi:ribonuclease P protein component
VLKLNKKFSIIKKRKDFIDISKSDLKWVCPAFIMQIKKKEGIVQNRIGFTVSKKVSKKAVVRNRIKRRLRALAKETLKDNVIDGVDFVLIGRKSTLDTEYSDMLKSMKHCLKRLNLEK